MQTDFYRQTGVDSFYLPVRPSPLPSLDSMCSPLPAPLLFGSGSPAGAAASLTLLGRGPSGPPQLAPPGEGASEDQMLEYALFVSKVEAAAKGWDKQEDQKRLKERLELFGFEEKKTRDDGNCQFCAVSDQLYGHEGEHAAIRATVIDWLRLNKNWNPSGQEFGELHRFINDEPWDDYLLRMSKDKQWGDHLTLVAISEIFNVSIFIISSVPGDRFLTQIVPGARESYHSGRRATIFLAHHLELHYISIREKQDVTLSISGWSAPPAGILAKEPPVDSYLPLPNVTPPSSASSSSSPLPTLKLLLVAVDPPEARRFPLDRWPSLEELDAILRRTFGSRLPYDYILKYRDEDGDLVTIGRQSELADAIYYAQSKLRDVLSLEVHKYPRLAGDERAALPAASHELLGALYSRGFTDPHKNIVALIDSQYDLNRAMHILQKSQSFRS